MHTFSARQTENLVDKYCKISDVLQKARKGCFDQLRSAINDKACHLNLVLMNYGREGGINCIT